MTSWLQWILCKQPKNTWSPEKELRKGARGRSGKASTAEPLQMHFSNYWSEGSWGPWAQRFFNASSPKYTKMNASYCKVWSQCQLQYALQRHLYNVENNAPNDLTPGKFSDWNKLIYHIAFQVTSCLYMTLFWDSSTGDLLHHFGNVSQRLDNIFRNSCPQFNNFRLATR